MMVTSKTRWLAVVLAGGGIAAVCAFRSGVRTLLWPGRQQGQTVRSPQDTPGGYDDRWIGKILDFEATKGSARGTGLANWGYNSRAPKSRAEAIRYFRQDYLPLVQHYPIGVRERIGDYLYNTGRNPHDLLLYAAGYITLVQLNGKADLSSVWNRHQAQVQAAYSDPAFLHKIDRARDDVYRTTKMIDGHPNPAYEASWAYRVKLWSDSIH